MRALNFLTSFLIILSMSAEFAMGETKTFEWHVTNVSWNPDGVKGWVLAINGQFPGPTINVTKGDNIVVKLYNWLQTEGLAIHWHGIRQYGTTWADGTANITQCPIKPGRTLTYNFTVDKAGTYFYHGHYKMLRTAGLYGSLIVNDKYERDKIEHYDGELNVLLSDWWHKSTEEQEADLFSIPMKWIGEAQSLLINGRGQFGCYLAAAYVRNSSAKPQCKFTGKEQYAPDILHVQPNKKYRLRLASTTSLASLSFAIGNHKLKVVEADGNLVEPFHVESLYIYPGQTYSVIIYTNQAPKSYWVSVDVIARQPNTTQGLTILTYNLPNNFTYPNDLPTSPPLVSPLWNDFNRSISFAKMIRALAGSPTPPTNSTRIIKLLNTQNLINGQTKWALNNVSLVLPSTPYLATIKRNPQAYKRSPPIRFSRDYNIRAPPVNQNARNGSRLYKFNLSETVDIILQNANALKENVSEVHPWHLHGHDFWVLGYGEGMFKNDYMKNLNFHNPPLRQTDVIFPYGWTALRFVADNPGVWAFHCHIEPHLAMGMGVVFAEGVEKIGKIPYEGLGCGQRA